MDELTQALAEIGYSELSAENEVFGTEWSQSGAPIIPHDWRNHIPERLQACWRKLDTETRLVAFILAETQAQAEEWE